MLEILIYKLAFKHLDKFDKICFAINFVFALILFSLIASYFFDYSLL